MTRRGKRKAGCTTGRDWNALGDVGSDWTWDTPLRTEYARRAALVEIDALVAVWLGFEIEEFLAAYESRFSVLADHEDEMYFDANGRKLAADYNQWGHGQTKEHWKQFEKYLEDPAANPPPDGYAAPFYKADRVAEYRQAHAVFSERLRKAQGRVTCGETDAGRGRTEDEPHPVPVHDVRAGGSAGAGGAGEVPQPPGERDLPRAVPADPDTVPARRRGLAGHPGVGAGAARSVPAPGAGLAAAVEP